MIELLTPHFSISELTATDLAKYRVMNYEAGLKMLGKMYMLAGFAERVREIIGMPLIVNSAYRCPELNKAVGGSRTSQHCLAEALDIKVKGKTAEELFRMIVVSDLKYDQLIWERPKGSTAWLHVSIGSKKEKLKYDGKKYTSFS